MGSERIHSPQGDSLQGVGRVTSHRRRPLPAWSPGQRKEEFVFSERGEICYPGTSWDLGEGRATEAELQEEKGVGGQYSGLGLPCPAADRRPNQTGVLEGRSSGRARWLEFSLQGSQDGQKRGGITGSGERGQG